MPKIQITVLWDWKPVGMRQAMPYIHRLLSFTLMYLPQYEVGAASFESTGEIIHEGKHRYTLLFHFWEHKYVANISELGNKIYIIIDLGDSREHETQIHRLFVDLFKKLFEFEYSVADPFMRPAEVLG